MEAFQPGDLIKIPRKGGVYYHWVIYAGKKNGEDMVLHMTAANRAAMTAMAGDAVPAPDILAYADPKAYEKALEKDLSENGEELLLESSGGITAEIKEDCLKDVLKGSKAIKDNSLDTKYKARSPQDTLQVARSWLGMKVKYSLLYFNCEHFAHLCRNGKVFSCQVNIYTFKIAGHTGRRKLRKVVGEEVFRKIEEDLIDPEN